MGRLASYRSAVLAYAIRGAIGAALGAFFPLVDAAPFGTTVFGATVGFIAGLFFWRLRWMRERGGVYYFYSWGLSVGAGVALVLLPETFKTREWLAYVVFVAFSITAGFGLGAYILLIIIKNEEKDD